MNGEYVWWAVVLLLMGGGAIALLSLRHIPGVEDDRTGSTHAEFDRANDPPPEAAPDEADPDDPTASLE